MTQEGEEFAIRIVKVDHYLAPPVWGLDEVYSEFKNTALTKVPVIRIFGITRKGEKACAHLHGVFPYICIPYDGIPTQIYDLAVSLERCLSASATNRNANESFQYIYKIEPVMGIPYYGYHKEEQQFLKIYFLNPWSIEKAVELLQSGAIMNRSFQPHEAHIPYILQMFIDYNLYGMNFAKFNKVAFRSSGNDLSDAAWALEENSTVKLNKQTLCKVEVDVTVSSIVNRLDLIDCDLNPGIAAIWEDAKIRRRCMMETSQLTPVSSQERPVLFPTKSELLYLKEVDQKLDTLDVSRIEGDVTGGGSEFRDELGRSSCNLESQIICSPISMAGLSQVNLDEDDVELVNILNGLVDVDVSDKETTEQHRELLDVNEVHIDEEDELAMSQRIEYVENIENDLITKEMQNDFLPQVDGPIGSPKDEDDDCTSLTKLLRSYRLKSNEAASNEEAVHIKVEIEDISSSVSNEKKNDCQEITMEELTKEVEIVEATKHDLTVSVQADDSDAIIFFSESKPDPQILPVEDIVKLEHERPPSVIFDGECNRYMQDIEINGVKVKVSPAIVERKELAKLGQESIVLQRLTEKGDHSKINSEIEEIDISLSSCETIEIMDEYSDKPLDETVNAVDSVILENKVTNEELVSGDTEDVPVRHQSPIRVRRSSRTNYGATYYSDALKAFDRGCDELIEDLETRTTRSQAKRSLNKVATPRKKNLPTISQEILKYPVVLLERLDEATINKFCQTKETSKTRVKVKRANSLDTRRISRPTSSKTRKKNSKDFNQKRFPNGYTKNMICPTAEVHKKMQEIVDNQNRPPMDSSNFELNELGSDTAYLVEDNGDSLMLSVDVDVMWGLSYLSPPERLTPNESSSPPNCNSPTIFTSTDNDELQSSVEDFTSSAFRSTSTNHTKPSSDLKYQNGERIVDTDFLSPSSSSAQCLKKLGKSKKVATKRGGNFINGHHPIMPPQRSPKVPRDRKRPAKLVDFGQDDDVSEDSPIPFSIESNFKRTNSKPKRPPRSRHKATPVEILPTISEDQKAADDLAKVLIADPAFRVDTNEVEQMCSSSSHLDPGNVPYFLEIAANENVSAKTSDRVDTIPTKSEDDGYDPEALEMLGLSNIMSCSQSLNKRKTPKLPKSKKTFIGPKRPRGRPRKTSDDDLNNHFKVETLVPNSAPILSDQSLSCAAQTETVERQEVGDWACGAPLYSLVEDNTGSYFNQTMDDSTMMHPLSAYGSDTCTKQQNLLGSGPPVVVELINPVYSDNLINVYDRVGDTYGIYPSDDLKDSGTSFSASVDDIATNKTCESTNIEFLNSFLNHPLPSAVEDRRNSVDREEANILMSDIEKIVNEMDSDQYNGDSEMVDSMTLALCRQSSEETLPFESKDSNAELVESSSEQTRMLVSLTSSGGSSQSLNDNLKKHWLPTELTMIHECSEGMQTDGNVTDLSQNVHSFYKYDMYATCDWINDSLIGTSTNLMTMDDSLLLPASGDCVVPGRVYTPSINPPTPSTVSETLQQLGLPHVRHCKVHCSDPKDLPEKPVTLGGGAVVLKLKCLNALQEAHCELSNTGLSHWIHVLKIARDNGHSCPINCIKTIKADNEPSLYSGLTLESSLQPPTRQQVQKWLDSQSLKKEIKVETSQHNTHVEKLSRALSQASSESIISPILSSSQKSTVVSDSPAPFLTTLSTILESTPVSSAKRNRDDCSLLGKLDEDMKPKSFFGSLQRKRLNLESPSISPKEIIQKGAIAFPSLDPLKQAVSQLDGPTPKNKFGFKVSEESLIATNGAAHRFQHLTVMSMELHADCTGNLSPHPKFNEVRAAFYYIHKDSGPKQENAITGCIYTTKPSDDSGISMPDCLMADENVQVTAVASELELISYVIQLVQDHDPDIMLGYEIEMNSWGFLIERASVLGVELWSAISRVPDDRANTFREPGPNGEFKLKIVGRIILAVGGLMKSEMALYIYTFENVAYHVLHKRVPLFTFTALRDWFDRPVDRWRTTQHFLIRAKGNFQLLDSLNVIGRTSELARLFGIQFEEVITRGTQFRVESMMLRFCRSLKYVAVSPNVRQRAAMRAPECLPLILEPISRLFTDPVVVLDFQSLYPSIIIAYNYCFSTCLGRVSHFGEDGPFPFGCTALKIPPALLKTVKDKITVSPCGVAFVKSGVRKGVLPRMLEEILAARVMVKLEMKKRKGDQALNRMLDARQLGLKLIANVTYGYTSANYSGRMPCVEIADSIVNKSRETLERAIQLVESTSRWGAQVVYGDTDSMFVLLKGRTKQQAFEIGQEIAQAVTAENPKPVKLKLEKVYLPCVLETKKRYVGFMYESPDAHEPVYDAKGIETVRRDGCPAVAKILERSLKTLFRTKDVSQVKSYVQHQFHKLIVGRCGLNEYVFTREYRGRNGYNAANHAPALKIATNLERSDSRLEPRIGERVPYVVVYGKPGDILIDLVRHPSQILMDSSLRLNAQYYINNVICPALARAFSLVGVDVRQWYTTLPKSTRLSLPSDSHNQATSTISHYFRSANCSVCDMVSQSAICANCSKDPQKVIFVLNDRAREWERRHQHITKVCQACTGTPENQLSCVSLDCPVLFRLSLSSRDACQARYLRNMIENCG